MKLHEIDATNCCGPHGREHEYAWVQGNPQGSASHVVKAVENCIYGRCNLCCAHSHLHTSEDDKDEPQNILEGYLTVPEKKIWTFLNKSLKGILDICSRILVKGDTDDSVIVIRYYLGAEQIGHMFSKMRENFAIELHAGITLAYNCVEMGENSEKIQKILANIVNMVPRLLSTGQPPDEITKAELLLELTKLEAINQQLWQQLLDSARSREIKPE